jgi:hypothetical protein
MVRTVSELKREKRKFLQENSMLHMGLNEASQFRQLVVCVTSEFTNIRQFYSLSTSVIPLHGAVAVKTSVCWGRGTLFS